MPHQTQLWQSMGWCGRRGVNRKQCARHNPIRIILRGRFSNLFLHEAGATVHRDCGDVAGKGRGASATVGGSVMTSK
jgi:hypothetical protein